MSDHSFPSACESDFLSAVTDAYLAHDSRLPSRLAALLTGNPQSIIGNSFKAILSVMLARAELVPEINRCAARAAKACRAHGASRRDATFARAAIDLAAGRWLSAIDHFDRYLDDAPGDSLAVKIVHGLRFMIGDASGMLRSIGRVLDRIEIDHPHMGFMLGCRAFALEELGAYRDAEIAGSAALERESRDVWGLHALLHVEEMTGQSHLGRTWLIDQVGHFDQCNNFRFHLHWHVALFRIEAGDLSGALDLYDQKVRCERTDDFRDIANAVSLLKRLELRGVCVARRWEELADICRRRINDRSLVFADLHYVLALASAGHLDDARRLCLSMHRDPARSDHQTRVAETLGAPIAAAIIDHQLGQYDAAITSLSSVLEDMVGIGGSNAQRDLFRQIMVDSVFRKGSSTELQASGIHHQAEVVMQGMDVTAARGAIPAATA